MMYPHAGRLRCAYLIILLCSFSAKTAIAQDNEQDAGQYRGVLDVVRFDVSPALRDIPPIIVTRAPAGWGGLIADPNGYEGLPRYGPQSSDPVMQSDAPSGTIPAPSIVFDTLPNQLGFSPPDPVGDIGPNHYVTMSNVHFVVHDRLGNQVLAPMANNTLWSGFGGQCESQNAGDPIILYDQFADRWLLTQFTSSGDGGGIFYNCVALSTSPDPTGSYFRWQISNGTRFPDYPKYGIGEEAYYISTRDFTAGYDGVGAFALNRAEMIAGNPSPTIVSFFVDRSNPENVGDGLLPMDVDGDTWAPDSSKHYYFGTMDDGGPYGAAQDAITVWEFIVDFATPANSSFTLTNTLPVAPYDSIFSGCSGRNCIPQPDTTAELDHQGYRQRPLHRAAYRNFGTHESIVFNQSAEADPGISGIRWWEVRNPGTSPAVFQEGTFAPGNTDGIHRWFGSMAMDSSGNIALGYSAANETTFPSIWYSGRLVSDPLGTLPQGEGVIVDGLGSQTSTGSRWGDYTSMNIDPLDDCTFWYLNEWYPATSSTGWTLRVGAFTFEECGEPGFTLVVPGDSQASICQSDEAMYGFDVGSIQGFDMPVTLSSVGEPAGTTASFSPNPVPTLPGASTLTISDTGSAVAGDYVIDVTGTAAGAADRMAQVELSVFDAVPPIPVLTAPADEATGVVLDPTFEWTAMDAEEYSIELATDELFGNIIWAETTSETSITLPFFLDSNTTYYWQVSPTNACGFGTTTAPFSFTTQSLPGDCPPGESLTVVTLFDFESGAQGWTSGSNLGPNTWGLSGTNPNSGSQHWHTDDVAEPSDTFLTSPSLNIPNGLSNLTFRFFNFQNFEVPPPPNCWDGGMLEVSTDGGSNFVEVVNGDLLTDPYDGPLRNDSSNPLGDRDAWCGAPQPYTDSRVDISGLAGEANVVFRFRVGTDVAAGAPGWDIDDVAIAGCTAILDFEQGFENPEL